MIPVGRICFNNVYQDCRAVNETRWSVQHLSVFCQNPAVAYLLEGVSIASYASPVLAIVGLSVRLSSVCPLHAGTE